MAALLATGAAQAQTVTFEQDRSARDAIGWPSHRATPVVADFNGDGTSATVKLFLREEGYAYEKRFVNR